MEIFSLTGFAFGGAGAWLAMKLGDRLGLSDIPNHRSSHVKVIPKGGGVGIVAACFLGGLLIDVPIFLWLPAMMIAVISFWGGDRHCLAVRERLFAQFACSFVFALGLMCTKNANILTYLLCIPATVFIVGTSNFYNFMDGIDGIAGITGIVAFLLLWFFSQITMADNVYQALCLLVAVSCAGFLPFNFPRARVFLGDIGSVVLGFLFACLVCVLAGNTTDFLVAVGFLGPFYFDELFTMWVRFKDGDSLIVPHRKHLYQLLANEMEMSHWKVSVMYALFQLIIGVSAILAGQVGILAVLLVYLFYLIIFIAVSTAVRQKVSSI